MDHSGDFIKLKRSPKLGQPVLEFSGVVHATSQLMVLLTRSAQFFGLRREDFCG
jgi:hypothetical protein